MMCVCSSGVIVRSYTGGGATNTKVGGDSGQGQSAFNKSDKHAQAVSQSQALAGEVTYHLD